MPRQCLCGREEHNYKEIDAQRPIQMAGGHIGGCIFCGVRGTHRASPFHAPASERVREALRASQPATCLSSRGQKCGSTREGRAPCACWSRRKSFANPDIYFEWAPVIGRRRPESCLELALCSRPAQRCCGGHVVTHSHHLRPQLKARLVNCNVLVPA